MDKHKITSKGSIYQGQFYCYPLILLKSQGMVFPC